ncbi:MAG TPA: hypothetical protein VIH27_06785 [Nitrososphaerales archaeon]
MPKQLKTADEFRKIAENAKLCKVVKRGDVVKLKLKTSNTLYTYITDVKESDDLVKNLKIEKVNI